MLQSAARWGRFGFGITELSGKEEMQYWAEKCCLGRRGWIWAAKYCPGRGNSVLGSKVLLGEVGVGQQVAALGGFRLGQQSTGQEGEMGQ